MKPLVMYHANCTDGFGAAFAAWLKLGDEAEYLPMNYMKTDDKSSADLLHEFSAKKIPGACISEREVFIFDFSLPRCVMDWLFGHAKRVVWLDHHTSVFKDWGVPLDDVVDELTLGLVQPNDHTVILDNNKSGALLAWEYFHPNTKVPKLIQHIDDRDRGVFALPGSKELHAALNSLKPWSFEQWKREFLPAEMGKSGLSFDQTAKYSCLQKEGTAILRAHNQHVQAALKQARLCQIVKPGRQRGFFVERPWGHRVSGPNHLGYFDEAYVSGLAANAPAFLASDLGHELANKSGTFGLVWSMAGDGQIHCSLRSNGDYDVSAIAKAFGGGGHRNAAGFSTDIDTLMSWLK